MSLINEGQVYFGLVQRVVVAKYEENTPRTYNVMIKIQVSWSELLCYMPNTYALGIVVSKNKTSMYFRGRVIEVVPFKPLAPHHSLYESNHILPILLCEEAIQQLTYFR
jgi:hypothetical protein